ncbi:MAG: VanZ family protein [Bacteroidota bacterium]|nr:VanZ family protein [Bacteroidota bacterium]
MRKKVFFLLAVLWTVGVIVLSLVSFSSMSGTAVKVPFLDKLVHFTFYAVFVYLWGNSISSDGQTRFVIIRNLVIIAVFLGLILEVLQELCTEYRSMDFYDALANSVGAGVGAYILRRRD